MLSPLLPSPSFFLPEVVKRRRFRERVLAAGYHAPNVLHLTHGFCLDGAACDALVRMHHGTAAVSTLYLEPHETVDALDVLARVPSRARRLVVSDLSFQKGQGDRVLALVTRLAADGGWHVEWRDHHHKQWEGAPVDELEKQGRFTVDFSGAECGATLVQKALLPDDAFAKELARLVRDHDLWLLEDSRSLRLQAAVASATSARFVAHLLETRSLDDATLERWADEEEARRERLVREGVAAARLVLGERAVVGVAYGRLPANDVLHALDEKGAHLSVLLKPGGTFSLRSRKDVPVCQRVASGFGGGGHPNASGGRLRIPVLALPAYWARRGDAGPARDLVRAAVREVDDLLRATRD